MAENDAYDLIVIGGGPGGYIAAERAGARGKKVLLIEQAELGGVCLNEGCIPSKTLLNSAKLYRKIQHAAAFGVHVEGASFDLPAVMARKAKVVKTLVKGVAYQMKRHHVEVVTGRARLVDSRTVAVGDQQFEARSIIIATGSSAAPLPVAGADLPHVITSKDALELEDLPSDLVVVGGGFIGIELASFFSAVGVNVTVIEMLPEILPYADPELAQAFRKHLRDVTFHLGAKVEEITAAGVTLSTGEASETVVADRVLACVGRRPNVEGLGLEEIGVDFDAKGIRVDDQMQTSIPNVYAVGDVTGILLLAHSASRMGEVAVSNMFGDADQMRYGAIPWVAYTDPELAGVGLTEAQAAAEGRTVQVAQLPFRANGRFLAEHEREPGVCKVIVDAESKLLLGVHMIGPSASEIIYGAAAMIEAELRVADIRELVFPHPTVSEIFRDTIWEVPA